MAKPLNDSGQIDLLFGVQGGGSVKELNSSGERIKNQIQQIVNELNNSDTTKIKLNYEVNTKNAEHRIKAQTDAIQAQIVKSFHSIKNLGIDGAAFDKKFKNVLGKDQFKNLKNEIAEYERLLDTVATKTSDNKLIFNKDATVEQMQAVLQLQQRITGYTNKQLILENSNTKAVQNTALSQQKLLDTISKYQQKYSSTLVNTPRQAQALQELFDEIKGGKYEGRENVAQAKILDLQNTIRSLGGETETLGQKIKRVFGEKLGYGFLGVGALYARQALQQVITNVIELDSCVTDLQIATGKTREETKELLSTYSQMGRELGVTTTEVAQAADTWLRQGYSIEESNELIKKSMMLSKLGQMNSADASVALTSALKGYKLEASEAANITDKLVSVDMVAAASSGDIATAMAECANSARIAGVDMNTLIGYLTTVKEVTQDGAESVGTFAKTLFARMGNIKSKYLVDPETGEDISDVERTLSGVGIQLRSANDQFRDFDDVLTEVASHWNNYSNVQQHAIAVAFAG